MRKIYKKGDGRQLNYIVFLALFMSMLSIGAIVLGKDLFVKKQTSTNYLVNQWDTFWDWLDSNILQRIPVIGDFFKLLDFTIELTTVHPFVSIIMAGLLGIPLTYVILRLKRGGG